MWALLVDLGSHPLRCVRLCVHTAGYCRTRKVRNDRPGQASPAQQGTSEHRRIWEVTGLSYLVNRWLGVRVPSPAPLFRLVKSCFGRSSAGPVLSERGRNFTRVSLHLAKAA